MNPSRNELQLYISKFRLELTNILTWWQDHAVEKSGDGFYGAADLEGNPVPEANKSCVLNARILWTFSAAAKMLGNSAQQAMARRAFKVISDKFADHEFGGYYMELTHDHHIANDIKHTYAQAFVLYALSKYYELEPSPDLMERIQSHFHLLEEKTRDQQHPGYMEAFTRDWKPLQENRMADNNEPRSMNTHLHLLEAYAALYNVWKDERVRRQLSGLLNLFLHKIIRDNGHLGIFFDKDFNETESSKGICSFGHDIEGSWLLLEAAEILGDEEITEAIKRISVKMAGVVEREGVDKDGGLFLESVRFGSHLRTNKHWWLQAENLVGFMNAFELTGDLTYWEGVKLSWDFIESHVIDHIRGEWYTKVNRLGVPFLEEPEDDPSPYYRNDWKIDPWKCPYHNGRAMMELVKRTERILTKQNFRL
ncbi:MAG: AGE family epimerase/isomerase [Bacteroidota bacterium]